MIALSALCIRETGRKEIKLSFDAFQRAWAHGALELLFFKIEFSHKNNQMQKSMVCLDKNPAKT